MSFLRNDSQENELTWRARWLPSMRQTRLVAMWCVLYLLLAVLDFLHDSLWFILACLGLWFVALILACASLLYLPKIGRAPGAVLLTIALLPTAVMMLRPLLSNVASRGAFELRKQDFQRVVDLVSRGGAEIDGGTTERGTRYTVDLGPPRRIAFVTEPGFVDNWSGVVHDPSHAVAWARAPSWRAGGASVPKEVRELFGGDIVTCRHLSGAFYRCGFT